MNIGKLYLKSLLKSFDYRLIYLSQEFNNILPPLAMNLIDTSRHHRKRPSGGNLKISFNGGWIIRALASANGPLTFSRYLQCPPKSKESFPLRRERLQRIATLCQITISRLYNA